MFKGTANSVWDWDTDTIKQSWHTSAYALNLDTNSFYSDVTNEVANSGDYTGGAAGGNTLASPTVTYDAATDESRLDAADTSNAGVTWADFRYAVFRKSTGTAATSPLIGVIDTGATQSVSSGNVSITYASNGIFVADST